jgi:hypothetical protein
MTRMFLLLTTLVLVSAAAGLFRVQFSGNHHPRTMLASIILFCAGLFFMCASFVAPTW